MDSATGRRRRSRQASRRRTQTERSGNPEEKEEEERVRQLQAERKRQEEERARKRLQECETLITEAKRLAERKKFKESLAKIEEAQSMNIAQKEDELTALYEKVTLQKKRTIRSPASSTS